MPFLQRHRTLWVLLAIAAAIGLGRVVSKAASARGSFPRGESGGDRLRGLASENSRKSTIHPARRREQSQNGLMSEEV